MTLMPAEESYLGYSEPTPSNPKKILSITYSPDGKYVAIARQLGSLTIFNTATGTIIMTLKSHGGDILSVGFSPDGRQIATSSMDGTLVVNTNWNGTFANQQMIFQLSRHPSGGSTSVSATFNHCLPYSASVQN